MTTMCTKNIKSIQYKRNSKDILIEKNHGRKFSLHRHQSFEGIVSVSRLDGIFALRWPFLPSADCRNDGLKNKKVGGKEGQ